MITACFREDDLHQEIRAHLKQQPTSSYYAKGRMLGLVSLGANKLFFLLVFLLVGMVKCSAQTRIKNTKNRVNKTVRRIVDTVMRGTNRVLIRGQDIVKHDTVVMVKVNRDTVYFPKPESIESGDGSFLGFAAKALPKELAKLIIEAAMTVSLILIWKKLKIYFNLLRRWRRRRHYKKSFL